MARGATVLLLAALLPTLARAVPSSRLSPRTLPSLRLPSPQACAERIVDKLEQPHEALSVTATKANGGPLRPLELLWRFSRPHTLIGSAMCIPALSLFAAPSSVPAATLLSVLVPLVSYATLPSLLINIYITGLNQLFDVEIDKVNKPKLPLASGEMTLKQGWAIVIACLCLGAGLGYAHPPLSSPALRSVLVGSALLGTAYSVPPVRLKRYPLMASFCIMAVRGGLINWAFFQHAATTGFGAPLATPIAGVGAVLSAMTGGLAPPVEADLRLRCIGATIFYTLFGIVIALVKDVPDVAGDRIYGINSFSVRTGQQQVLTFAVGLLTVALIAVGSAVSIAANMAMTKGLWARAARRAIAAGAAFFAARFINVRLSSVDPLDVAAVYSYYMQLWKVFYGSYLMMPFAR